MSDVKQAIRNWRNALSGEEALDESVLDELQDHLHAEIDRLPTTGLSTEERVLLAAHRIGAPDALGVQFATDRTASIWARRIYWAAMGWFVFTLPGLIATLLGQFTWWVLLVFNSSEPRGGHFAGIVGSGSLILLWTGLACFLKGRFRRSDERHSRSTIWMIAHPGFSLAVAATLVCVGHVLGQIGVIALVHRSTATDMATFASWNTINWIATWLLVPILLAGLAWHRLRRTAG